MNFLISETAENSRLIAAFYKGFARLLEGVDDDNEDGFKQFAEVFDIMARYGDDMSYYDIVLLAHLAGAYEAEHDGDLTLARRSFAAMHSRTLSIESARPSSPKSRSSSLCRLANRGKERARRQQI